MTPTRTPTLGFRVLGSATERRRLVDHAAAFAAYAECDDKAEVNREAYLSAFTYGEDFRHYLQETGSTRGYDGPCWAPYLWFDLDGDDLNATLAQARGLAAFLLDRYRSLDDDALLLFFSGSKGFHIGLPVTGGLDASVSFHRVARRFAEALASDARVTIDYSVYDKVRLFRAPNSKHPKTGLHKRRLTLDELLHLDAGRIRQVAVSPNPFGLLVVTVADPQAAADWQAAVLAVGREGEAKAQRRAAVADGMPRLNRATLDFVRDSADQGDRHRLLFSAAANLAEFGCPPALAHALLTDPGLDCGLSPSEVRRQIDSGLAHVGPLPPATPAAPTAATPAVAPATLQTQLAALWRTPAPSDGPYGTEGGRR